MNTTILPGAKKRVPQDANKSVTITITRTHHKNAVKCDGRKCVVAQAFDDSNIGEFYEGAEIGLSVTKLSFQNKILLQNTVTGY